jgi:hypothetical protein
VKAKPKSKTMPQGFKNGGAVFKACSGCPAPAKCKMAGKCMKKK